MEACPAVGLGDGRSRMGVASESVTVGDESEDGVEACSVASRSGLGEELGAKSRVTGSKQEPVRDNDHGGSA